MNENFILHFYSSFKFREKYKKKLNHLIYKIDFLEFLDMSMVNSRTTGAMKDRQNIKTERMHKIKKKLI